MNQPRGFTLVEVMIVVAIIGILAAIAYPSYDEYVKRGHRTEGQALLSDAAARQERYFAQNNSYQTDITKLGIRSSTTSGVTSETGKYTLAVATVANDGGYTLTATQQFNDNKCGNLVMKATGIRGAAGKLDSGNAADKEKVRECWR